jgi:methylphosphotriester-DNA--protein-cysteine methyltransferase
MRRAVELLRDGTPVKRTAYMLGYKEPTSFGHDFKRCFGLAPRKFCMTGGKINAPKNVAF